MKIEKKKAENKVEAKVVEVPKKKSIVAEKKAEEAKAPEAKPAEKQGAKVETSESPKIERPNMPADFCMQPSDWEGTGECYDPNSNNCMACEKDFPETAQVCKARADFLGIMGKAGKTAKAKKAPGQKAVRVKKNGKLPQSLVIDGYLKESKPLTEMISALAESDFGGCSEAGLKAAGDRITSHLKAIDTGKYCRTAEMKPFVAYLKAKPAKAPKAAEAKK